MKKNKTKTAAEEPEYKMKRTNMSRSKKILSLLQFALLLGIIIGIPAALYFCNPEIIENFKSIDKFNAWIADYKGIGLIIYLICQIAQIVICVLPGQVIQIAGGYLFGFVVTFFISIIGAVIGTVITFYLAKLLGRNAIMLICGEQRFHKYQRIMSTQRARKIIFLIYLIPASERPFGVRCRRVRYQRAGIYIFVDHGKDSRDDSFHSLRRESVF